MGSRYVGKLSERKNNGMRTVIGMTIGLAVMAGTVQADPTFINTCPTVISSPGRYLLGADLICGGGDGITITSPNVTLALEGHMITAGVGANRAIFVNNARNVSILGPGLITNGGDNTFSSGVFLFNMSNAEVSGITVRGANAGIATSLGGLFTFTANTLGRNGVGINIGDSINNTISDNDASGNGTGILIQVEIGTLGTVSHNVLNGNTGAGLVIFVGDIAGGTVQNNVINGNDQYGISAFNANLIVVTNNIVLANRTDLNGICGSGNTFFTSNPSCPH
jgi:parallel beta-helix repeat protein